jgi:hypothetical protein
VIQNIHHSRVLDGRNSALDITGSLGTPTYKTNLTRNLNSNPAVI